MLYTDAEQVRCRMNHIGRVCNEATNYGRDPLPEKFAALDREWLALADLYADHARLFNGGVEIEEATT